MLFLLLVRAFELIKRKDRVLIAGLMSRPARVLCDLVLCVIIAFCVTSSVSLYISSYC